MELTLIRHGESLANIGASEELDSALTPRGRRQALATGERLALDARANGDYTAILVSPFRRTLMTCEAIHAAVAAPVVLTHEICEYFAGHDPRYRSFVGMSGSQIRDEYPWVGANADLDSLGDWWPCEPEYGNEIYRRAERVRDQLIEQYADADRIVLISHAETIGRLVEALRRNPPAEDPPWTDNCGIWRLTVHGNTPATITLANDTSHLREAN